MLENNFKKKKHLEKTENKICRQGMLQFQQSREKNYFYFLF